MGRHTPLRRSPKAYEDFFCQQVGHGLPVFIGTRSQRGRGLGSFLSSVGRMVLPILKTGGKALLREGALTGMQVAQDALEGRNVKEAFRSRAADAGKRLLRGAVSDVSASIKRRATPRQTSHKKKKRKKTPSGASDIFS